jgi:chemotaxis-related protein WspD
MSDHIPDPVREARCWTEIGVWGDASCPELSRVGHCRNCEVYIAGGRQLLDRLAPADYLDLWTELLAKDKETQTAATTQYLVFRLGRSWLALRAVMLREVTHPSVIRSVPHQRSAVLLGLTAIRGEIYPCVSLHALLGETAPEGADPMVRLLVTRHKGAEWVFPVDEVSGIHDVSDEAIEPLPATLAHTGSVYTTGIAQCGDRSVGLIDEGLVFSALERRIT